MSQSSPWAPSSVLRGLAISSGCIALVSVVASNYLVAVLALLATGVLVVLYSNLAPTHSVRAHERSSAGAA
jgi:hypothetical protein